MMWGESYEGVREYSDTEKKTKGRADVCLTLTRTLTLGKKE